jgi:predicted RNase H-like HicB family nuclease
MRVSIGGYTVSQELTIIFEKGDSGLWVATIPEVPGAFSQGATLEEAFENALDALNELMRGASWLVRKT